MSDKLMFANVRKGALSCTYVKVLKTAVRGGTLPLLTR